MEAEIKLKPTIKNFVPDEEKFKLPLDEVMKAAEKFENDLKEYKTNFIPNSKSSVEYRPGVRKFTDKELERILGANRNKCKKKPSEESFSHYIDNHCQQPPKNVDKVIIDKRRRLPVQLMGLEKAIEKDTFTNDINEFMELIREVYENNSVSESIDGRFIHTYSIPLGYYTDYDGGRSTPKGNIFYKVFEDTEAVNSKARIISITSAAENGLHFIATLYNECNGIVESTDPLTWATSRFFSIVIKWGYSIYDSYHDYKYNMNHPSNDTHSYTRITFIPGGK